MQHIKNTWYQKRFSVGLSLEQGEEELLNFMQRYADVLDSIYFSVPLGRPYYSRSALSRTYDLPETERKLVLLSQKMHQLKIHREITLNTYYLDDRQIDLALDWLERTGIRPEEFVCLAPYKDRIRSRFPKAEIKYSFNNPTLDDIEGFDTLVVGKNYLRNREGRHAVFQSGYQIVLLLNNGCMFSCQHRCDRILCKRQLQGLLQQRSLEELYAEQSFFPSELKRLLAEDALAPQYRFKISNRPMGLAYTKQVLDWYLSLQDPSAQQFSSNPNLYGLFCTMGSMFEFRALLDNSSIQKFKQQLSI